MKKLMLLGVVFILSILLCTTVDASQTIQAKIGNRFFDTLEDAIHAASSKDIITLTSDVVVDNTVEIKKAVNINLNNHTISADEQVFLIQGGSLNLSGTGIIKETKPNYGAIILKGSDDPSQKDFSTVYVDKGITLQGWSGIFINHHNKTGYGILVNLNGNINAINDINGETGIGIYVNGYIQNQDNAPIINLSKTANITSTGNGIYSAGYATYNINGANISGVESGLAIKSGIFNILNANIIGIGENKTPTTGNNNGINPTGVTIQIESNPGYSGDIELNIKNGTFTSKNSHVIYEYTINNNNTAVKNIDISGGTFISKSNNTVFLLSNSLKNINTKFISGGTYSSDPKDYLKSGYTATLNNDMYKVTNSTISTFLDNNDNSNSALKITTILSLLIILGLIIYFNRNYIFNFFYSIKNKNR